MAVNMIGLIEEQIEERISISNYEVLELIRSYILINGGTKVYCPKCCSKKPYKITKKYVEGIPYYSSCCDNCNGEINFGIVNEVNNSISYNEFLKRYGKNCLPLDKIKEIPIVYNIPLEYLKIILDIDTFEEKLKSGYFTNEELKVLYKVYNYPSYYLRLLNNHKDNIPVEIYELSLEAAIYFISLETDTKEKKISYCKEAKI